MIPRSRFSVALVIGLCLTLAHCDAVTKPVRPFRLTILQPFGKSSEPAYTFQSYAYDIDPSGQAVGMAEGVPSGYGAALWPADGKPPLDLRNGEMVLQAAYGVNALGQVVGVGRCGGRGNACTWEAGDVRNLGSLDYEGLSNPLAINDHGDVAGWAYAPPGGFDHAVLWRNGVATDLGTLGGVQSQALGIDNQGRIVGWARPEGDQPTPRHAFLWQNGIMTDLGTLGGEESIAHAINERGQIVGWSGHIYGKQAFQWENGKMFALPGTGFSEAFAINNQGDIVGTYIPFGTTFHAALWRNGIRYDLDSIVNDPQLTLRWALAINDAGQIVGVGAWRGKGFEAGFLLTPDKGTLP